MNKKVSFNDKLKARLELLKTIEYEAKMKDIQPSHPEITPSIAEDNYSTPPGAWEF